MTKLFYYGCYDKTSGHVMREARGGNSRTAFRFTHDNPWGMRIDGGLCPKGAQIEGKALIHYKDGWTALSFWDRSVDMRGNSNSNFLADGKFTFEQMVEFAYQNFPEVTRRYKFSIVPA